MAGKALLILAIAALAACESGETPKRPGEQGPLFEPQQQALDRAQGVADTVRQQAERQRRQIDQASH